MTTATVRVRPGILSRLRELHRLNSEDALARLIGCDRSTLRRINTGDSPSSAFIAGAITSFDVPFDVLFQIVTTPELEDEPETATP